MSNVEEEPICRSFVNQICAVIERTDEDGNQNTQKAISPLWLEIKNDMRFAERPFDICQVCKEYIEPKRDHSKFLYHSFLDMLLNASKCCCCWLLFKYSEVLIPPSSVTKDVIEFLKSSKRLDIRFETVKSDGYSHCSFQAHKIVAFSLVMAVTEGSDLNECESAVLPDWYPIVKEIPASPTSETCISTVTSWIQECTRNHPACNFGREWRMPSRIIDIASQSEPFLAERVPSNRQYVALSYCWGSKKDLHPPKSTCKNLNFHKNRMDFSGLPVVFQEAIQITRALGIQYIWIDSLCIIQAVDDHECEKHKLDWRKEGAQMAEYYGNAFLTISPLDSSSCKESMLEPRAQEPFQIIGTDGLILVPSIKDWGQIFQSSVLQTRAWVLQERLLSRRVLHYGKDEMFWECLIRSWRERLQKSLTAQSSPGLLEDVDLKKTTSPARLSNYSLSNQTKLWSFVISNFTGRNLTNRSDRFISLSGIASCFKDRLKETAGIDLTYMAGLWKEHPGTLLWTEESSRSVWEDTSANDIYIAPSWSWASVNYSVHLPHSRTYPHGRRTEFNVKIGEFIMPTKDKGWASGFNVMDQILPGSRLSLNAFSLEVIIGRNSLVVLKLDNSKLGYIDKRISTKYYDDVKKILGDIRCTAIWILEEQEDASSAFVRFLLIMRERDLQPNKDVKWSNNVILPNGTNGTIRDPIAYSDIRTEEPDLWVRIGSGRVGAYVHKPTKDAPLGAFSSSERRDFILL